MGSLADAPGVQYSRPEADKIAKLLLLRSGRERSRTIFSVSLCETTINDVSAEERAEIAQTLDPVLRQHWVGHASPHVLVEHASRVITLEHTLHGSVEAYAILRNEGPVTKEGQPPRTVILNYGVNKYQPGTSFAFHEPTAVILREAQDFAYTMMEQLPPSDHKDSGQWPWVRLAPTGRARLNLNEVPVMLQALEQALFALSRSNLRTFPRQVESVLAAIHTLEEHDIARHPFGSTVLRELQPFKRMKTCADSEMTPFCAHARLLHDVLNGLRTCIAAHNDVLWVPDEANAMCYNSSATEDDDGIVTVELRQKQSPVKTSASFLPPTEQSPHCRFSCGDVSETAQGRLPAMAHSVLEAALKSGWYQEQKKNVHSVEPGRLWHTKNT